MQYDECSAASGADDKRPLRTPGRVMALAGLAALVLEICSAGGAAAAEGGHELLLVYADQAAAAPAERVIGSVRARECRADSSDARDQAIAALRDQAASRGATALVDVRVRVDENPIVSFKSGPNPCRFQTLATGSAVVLAAAPGGVEAGR